MKVLIVGSDKVYAIENFYVRYLRELGAEVSVFCSYNIFLDYYYASIFRKVAVKLGLSSIFRQISQRFEQEVKSFAPDVIWVFKGMEILPGALSAIAKTNTWLVNYNPDNPFIFSGRGSGNKNVTRSIPFYDLHFTYHLGVGKILTEKYHTRVALLPFGFEDTPGRYEECRKEPEVLRACFLGNPDESRASFIKQLADRGVPIDVYGNDWKNFLPVHEQIRLFPPAYEMEQWKILYKYRAQLNLMRIHNTDSHNMRSFEVPGVGGIMVAPDTPEHRMFFEDGSEVFLYTDVGQSAEQILTLLKMSAADSEKIRVAARKRSIESGYTYRDRAEQVYRVLQTLCEDEPKNEAGK